MSTRVATEPSRPVRWIANHCDACGKPGPSALGAEVAEILDEVFGGIYNAPVSHRRIDWANDHHIELCINRGLATFDGDHLTRLVVLCHDRCIRLDIEGAAPRYLRAWFHKRKGRDGSTYERHPTIEQAVARIRGNTVPPTDDRTPAGRAAEEECQRAALAAQEVADHLAREAEQQDGEETESTGTGKDEV